MIEQREEGFVLATVLWLLAALFIAAAGLSFLQKVELRVAAFSQEKVRTAAWAREGLARAEQDILAAWAEGEPWRVPAAGQWREWSRGEAQGRVAVFNEAGKLSLIRFRRVILLRVLAAAGYGEEEQNLLVDSLTDWLDRDGVPREMGGEADFYRALTPPYEPRNGPVQTLGELGAIRGWGGARLITAPPLAAPPPPEAEPEEGPPPAADIGLWGLVTVYGRAGKLDVNSVPEEVLRALPDVTGDTVRRLLEARAQGGFANMRLLQPVVGEVRYKQLLQYLAVAPSRLYTIVSQAWLPGREAPHTLVAVAEMTRREGVRHRFWIQELITPPAQTGEARTDAAGFL